MPKRKMHKRPKNNDKPTMKVTWADPCLQDNNSDVTDSWLIDDNNSDQPVNMNCSARAISSDSLPLPDQETAEKVFHEIKEDCFNNLVKRERIHRKRERDNTDTFKLTEKALLLLHNEIVSLESRFQFDFHELEMIYQERYYGPLLRLRDRLIRTLEISKFDKNRRHLLLGSMGRPLESIEEESEDNKPQTAFDHDDFDDQSLLDKMEDCPNPSGRPRPSFNPDVMRCPHCRNFLNRHNDFKCDCNSARENTFREIATCENVFRQQPDGAAKWKEMLSMINEISKDRYGKSFSKRKNRGIQNFWMKAFTHSPPFISRHIGTVDVKILACVTDVTVKYLQMTSGKHKRAAELIPSMGANKNEAEDTIPRCSSSLPSNIGSEDRRTDAGLNPSGWSKKLNVKRGNYNEGRVIGFEIAFKLNRNDFISNRVLTKRYTIDVTPGDDDFKAINSSSYKENNADSSFGCDESSSDENSFDNLRRKSKSRIKSKNHCMLDYSGPRLVAIDGCEVRWKPARYEDSRQPNHSFFDFFGVFWDAKTNLLNTIKRDGTTYLYKRNADVRPKIEQDYEIGKYIKDILCPRAYALYLSQEKFTPRHANHDSDSLVESISSCDSDYKPSKKRRHLPTTANEDNTNRFFLPSHFPNMTQPVIQQQPQQQHKVENPVQNPVLEPMPPFSIEKSLQKDPKLPNHMKHPTPSGSYDDVDDAMQQHKHDSSCIHFNNLEELDGDPPVSEEISLKNSLSSEIKPFELNKETEAIENSRKNIETMVKSINNLLQQHNNEDAESVPTIEFSSIPAPRNDQQRSYRPVILPPTHPPSVPLATKNLMQPPIMHNIRLRHESDMSLSPGRVSGGGNAADDEENWSDLDKQSVNPAFTNIKHRFKIGEWKPGKAEYDTSGPTQNVNPDDDIQSSKDSKKEMKLFDRTSAIASEEDNPIDSDNLSSTHDSTGDATYTDDDDMSSSDAAENDEALELLQKHGYYPSARNSKECPAPSGDKGKTKRVSFEDAICENILTDRRKELDCYPQDMVRPEERQDAKEEEEIMQIPSDDSEAPSTPSEDPGNCVLQ